MTSQEQLRNLVGTTAYDRDGDKLGKVGQVYYDDNTDQPKWVTVNTGLFGLNESFVPLQGADFSGDRLTVGYDKATVKNAPNIDEDGHLSPEEERALYQHYSLDYSTGRHTEHVTDRDRGTDRATEYDSDLRNDRDHDRTGVAGTIGAAGRTHDRDDRDIRTEGHDTSGPNTDNAMTRSEEHLVAGTQTEETGRARLRKRVVTEHEQVQVPVSREEVVVEREPITEANRGQAYDGKEISEEEHEITLHAERPVVGTETEAVERVKIGTETVRDTETVGGEVRKERIEVDEPTGDRRDRR